jgi:hypothetical protein
MNSVSLIRSVALIAASGLIFCATATAQSATSFNTKVLTPKAKTTKKEKSATAATPEAGPVSTTPSRFVAEADRAAYVESLAAIFSMKGRATDPFGQLQDPDAKPIVKPSATKKSTRVAQVQATPFSEIIRLIQVTTIMPGEKRFLVGNRSIKQGEHIAFKFRGRNINVEIASVNSRQIEFRNLDTGETNSIKLNLLPVGMTPGNGNIVAPGMMPNIPNAPIDLDTGTPTEEPAQNR